MLYAQEKNSNDCAKDSTIQKNEFKNKQALTPKVELIGDLLLIPKDKLDVHLSNKKNDLIAPKHEEEGLNKS